MKTELGDLRASYDRDGYAVAREVVDSELIAEASRHLEWLLARNPGVRPEQLHHWLMQDDPFWVRLVGDDRLLDVAERFIGGDLALFASHYISKPAREGQAVLWHQDGSYWPIDPMEVVTLWLAVDDSDPENGCLRVIPGTHRLPLQGLRPRKDVSNVLDSEIDPGLVNESLAVDVVLRRGDVSVHHPNVIHGSNANLSMRRRCGLTIRYIPTTTRVLSPDFWPNLFLLRGRPEPGINAYVPWPRYVDGTHFPFRGADRWNLERPVRAV